PSHIASRSAQGHQGTEVTVCGVGVRSRASPSERRRRSGQAMNRSGQAGDPVAVLLFTACVLIAAGNFVAVRFSNQELPPMWGAGLRFALAAVVFISIARLSRIHRARRVGVRRTSVLGV